VPGSRWIFLIFFSPERERHSVFARFDGFCQLHLPFSFFYMGLGLMILMAANLLLGPLEGLSLKISTFLGPKGARFACCHFAQKRLDCQSPPLPVAFEMD
jgi:hypothetical protein